MHIVHDAVVRRDIYCVTGISRQPFVPADFQFSISQIHMMAYRYMAWAEQLVRRGPLSDVWTKALPLGLVRVYRVLCLFGVPLLYERLHENVMKTTCCPADFGPSWLAFVKGLRKGWGLLSILSGLYIP